MNRQVSPIVIVICVLCAVAIAGFAWFLAVSKDGGSVEVHEAARQVLTEEDKARMRKGWTYDVRNKVWLDENFRVVKQPK